MIGYDKYIYIYTVSQLTGIRNGDLVGKQPLSVVLTEFLTWVDTTIKEVTERTDKKYFPGDQ